jgi:hypothetical protein
MSILSILGDTADFGRIKKKKDVFHYCLCLSPQEIEPGGCDFQLQTTICERVYTSDSTIITMDSLILFAFQFGW